MTLYQLTILPQYRVISYIGAKYKPNLEDIFEQMIFFFFLHNTWQCDLSRYFEQTQFKLNKYNRIWFLSLFPIIFCLVSPVILSIANWFNKLSKFLVWPFFYRQTWSRNRQVKTYELTSSCYEYDCNTHCKHWSYNICMHNYSTLSWTL